MQLFKDVCWQDGPHSRPLDLPSAQLPTDGVQVEVLQISKDSTFPEAAGLLLLACTTAQHDDDCLQALQVLLHAFYSPFNSMVCVLQGLSDFAVILPCFPQPFQVDAVSGAGTV